MIASGLTGKFWARAIFYAADISNIQYRPDLKMSPHHTYIQTSFIEISIEAGILRSGKGAIHASVGLRGA